MSAGPTPALPQALRQARRRAVLFAAALAGFLALCVASLDLNLAAFLSPDALQRMGGLLAEMAGPVLTPGLWARLLPAALETLAMSVVGTLLAVLLGLALALPASRAYPGDPARARGVARLLLNLLRSIPELLWAALLLVSAGLGPLAGTLALALHTTGVLGRLFAEALENLPSGPGDALRIRGIGEGRVFWYASWPLLLPQLLSYAMYRWENNIRAAAVLGVVGAGGLGQLLAYHLGLFQMGEAGAVMVAMLLLVLLVDGASYMGRRILVS